MVPIFQVYIKIFVCCLCVAIGRGSGCEDSVNIIVHVSRENRFEFCQKFFNVDVLVHVRASNEANDGYHVTIIVLSTS